MTAGPVMASARLTTASGQKQASDDLTAALSFTWPGTSARVRQ